MILYAAYGSNLNKAQMKRRCPEASAYTAISLENWRLVFKGVADIEKNNNSNLLLGLYKITKHCEKKLDIYEEYPNVYKKHYFTKKVNGKKVYIMLYIMNSKFSYSIPTLKYFEVIKEGYENWSFKSDFLFSAGYHSIKNNTLEGYKSKNWNDKSFLNENYLRSNG